MSKLFTKDPLDNPELQKVLIKHSPKGLLLNLGNMQKLGRCTNEQRTKILAILGLGLDGNFKNEL